MNIGIFGSGEVATALARGFLERGDQVMLGTRDAAKLASWRAAAGERAHVGSCAETARFGEIVLLATLGTATVDVVTGVGADAFAGKVVIDATNPIGFDDKGPHLAVGCTDSLGEQVQRALPGARVVKAFNTVGNGNFVHPQLPGGPPTMFIGGDDDDAKRVVTSILSEFGWETADLGGIAASRYLEPMCMAWVVYGFRTNTWTHAFKLLRPA